MCVCVLYVYIYVCKSCMCVCRKNYLFFCLSDFLFCHTFVAFFFIYYFPMYICKNVHLPCLLFSLCYISRDFFIFLLVSLWNVLCGYCCLCWLFCLCFPDAGMILVLMILIVNIVIKMKLWILQILLFAKKSKEKNLNNTDQIHREINVIWWSLPNSVIIPSVIK